MQNRLKRYSSSVVLNGCRWFCIITIAALSLMLGPMAVEAAGADEQAPTIRIGVNLELSGGIERFGQSTLKGIRLAFKEINQSGGLLGRQIELVELDNTSEPWMATNVMKKLATEENVVAALGCIASSDTMAAGPTAEYYHIPLISPTSTNPRVTVYNGQLRRYVFRTCFIDPFQGILMTNFAKNTLGANSAAIIIDDSSGYSKSLAEMFERKFSENGGRIVSKEYYREKDNDFSQQLVRTKATQPDVIYIPGYYEEVGKIVAQARNLGITVPLLGGDGWDDPKLVQIAGAQALNNTYFINHFGYLKNAPRLVSFYKSYWAEYGRNPDALATCGYEAAIFLAEAIKKAGSSDPESIRDALEIIDAEGLLGPISMDGNHNPTKPGVVIKMVDGRQTVFGKVDP